MAPEGQAREGPETPPRGPWLVASEVSFPAYRDAGRCWALALQASALLFKECEKLG